MKDYKCILHSKRANIFYLEKCRILQKDGRILFLSFANKKNQYWNIPIANTTVILLGIGTSITQAAVRLLCQAGVIIGFCGNGATPLLSGIEVQWFSPQNEYRPTEYIQKWLSFWYDESKRLIIAKYIQNKRIEYLQKIWYKENYFPFLENNLDSLCMTCLKKIEESKTTTDLLLNEAVVTKNLYKFSAENCSIENFIRNSDSFDMTNVFLNHGNYLSYGLAATVLWVLGIPHAFAVMHGKTRRGALVFDVADLIKDAIVLPLSFKCSMLNYKESDFRDMCVDKFITNKSLDFMFDVVKSCCELGENLGECDNNIPM